MANGLVIVMRAIPGSGKSTFIKKMLAKFENEGKNVLIASTDDYFYKLGEGKYKFDFTKLSQAHGACFRTFIEALQENVYDVVIVDNTNIFSREISPYSLGASAYDYNFLIKELMVDQEKAFSRQRHGVPLADHKQMSQNMKKEELAPWWEKEVYQESEDSTAENPKFDLLPPPPEPLKPTKKQEKITDEEEVSQTNKYSFQSLEKEIKFAFAKLK